MIGMCECVIGYIILIFIIPESPKWLYDKGKYNECQKTLSYMSRFNHRSGDHQTPEINSLYYFEEAESSRETSVISQKN